jgi:hypothetical protein
MCLFYEPMVDRWVGEMDARVEGQEWRMDIYRRNVKHLEKSLSRCCFVYQISSMELLWVCAQASSA